MIGSHQHIWIFKAATADAIIKGVRVEMEKKINKVFALGALCNQKVREEPPSEETEEEG